MLLELRKNFASKRGGLTNCILVIYSYSMEDESTKSYLQLQMERLKVLRAKLSTEAEEDYVIVKEE